MAEAAIELRNNDEALILFGPNDRTLRAVRERFGVDVVLRGLRVVVRGDKADSAGAALGELLLLVRRDGALHPSAVDSLVGGSTTKAGNGGVSGRLAVPTLNTTVSTAAALADEAGMSGDEPRAIEGVRLKTNGQRRYVQAIKDNGLVIAVGPAGTGKTFLAVLMAVQALKAGEVTRIVLCRPAVEAGEKLGFLPGDYQAKVNPYMRPLYDALHALLDFDTVKRYIEREVVEVAPLAYMRGRTLSSSFIILDEAQNTTRAQMKMFLTRMGEGSKIVVTGDATQLDLPRGTTSGLIHAQAILRDVEGIAIVTLGSKDIVRNPLVARIVARYEGERGGDLD